MKYIAAWNQEVQNHGTKQFYICGFKGFETIIDFGGIASLGGVSHDVGGMASFVYLSHFRSSVNRVSSLSLSLFVDLEPALSIYVIIAPLYLSLLARVDTIINHCWGLVVIRSEGFVWIVY